MGMVTLPVRSTLDMGAPVMVPTRLDATTAVFALPPWDLPQNSMAKSIKCSKPVINRAGDAVGRVKFYGKDKNGMQNWYKGIWIEYGTKNQPADPFVRPAIKSCESSIRAAMQKVFTQKTKR